MAHGVDDEAYRVLDEPVADAIERVAGERFSTKRLIDEIQSTSEGLAAYRTSLDIAGSGNEHMAHMIVHGQVIPGLLRASGRVRFAGFIHGEPAEGDEFHVPSWWRKV